MRTVLDLLIELSADAEVGFNNLGRAILAAVGALHVGDQKAAVYFLDEAFEIASSWARASRPGSKQSYLYGSVVEVLDGCRTYARVGSYPRQFEDVLTRFQEARFGPLHRRLAWYAARQDGYDYRF